MSENLIIKTEKEINDCIKKQEKLCEEKGYPHFAPKSGRCWKCNRNVYQNYTINGRISNGETGEEFITGCPHCHRSYCD